RRATQCACTTRRRASSWASGCRQAECAGRPHAGSRTHAERQASRTPPKFRRQRAHGGRPHMADEHMRPVGAALRVAAVLAALRELRRGTGALAGLAMSLVLGLLALPGVAAGAAGDLDPSFGAGRGFVTTLFSVSKSVIARAVVIQPSGRIVAGGGEAANLFAGPLLLAGYRPDGSLDPGFGDGGTGGTAPGAHPPAVVVRVAQQPPGQRVARAPTADRA